MEKSRAIELLKLAVPIKALTQQEYSDFVEAVNMGVDALEQPTTSDTISRQAAIDILHGYFDGMLDTDTVCPEDIYGLFECISPAQPEPAIPLSWIEKYIEWLKSFDNEFANLAAAHISVMVKKWRDEQNEVD